MACWKSDGNLGRYISHQYASSNLSTKRELGCQTMEPRTCSRTVTAPHEHPIDKVSKGVRPQRDDVIAARLSTAFVGTCEGGGAP